MTALKLADCDSDDKTKVHNENESTRYLLGSHLSDQRCRSQIHSMRRNRRNKVCTVKSVCKQMPKKVSFSNSENWVIVENYYVSAPIGEVPEYTYFEYERGSPDDRHPWMLPWSSHDFSRATKGILG